MAVTAQRFKFLDDETNVPTNDFRTANSSQPLNAPKSALDEITASLSSLIDGNKTDPEFVGPPEPSSSPLTRLAKDGISSLMDVSKLSVTSMEALTSKLFIGNDQAKSAFKLTGPVCKNNILGSMGNCRNTNTRIGYNGNYRNAQRGGCKVDDYSNLINRYGNGNYTPSIMDQCATQRGMTGIIDRGYQMGMPGVFDAVTSGNEDRGIISMVASSVMSKAIGRSDMNAVTEIANSAFGSTIRSQNPYVTQQTMRNYSRPSEIKESSLGGYFDIFTGGVELVDDLWNTFKNGSSSMLSASNMNSNNDELQSLFQAKCYETPSVLDTSESPTAIPDIGYLTTAMTFQSSDPNTSLSNSFPEIPQSSSFMNNRNDYLSLGF